MRSVLVVAHEHGIAFDGDLQDCLVDLIIDKVRQKSDRRSVHKTLERYYNLLYPNDEFDDDDDDSDDSDDSKESDDDEGSEPHALHYLYANYLVYHQKGNTNRAGTKARRIVRNWLQTVCEKREFGGVVPKDILAEDFGDYCRYHEHGSDLCYRLKTGMLPETNA